jgi:uncharacterized membrane protein YdjX (TVP38/TMEM64 family)
LKTTLIDSAILSRFMARGRWGKLLAYASVASLLIVAIVIAGEDISHHIDAIETWVTQLGPWGVLAFVGVYVLATSVMIPESVLSIMAGALFGLLWGFAAVAVGGLAAAALQYALSHRLLRQRIERLILANERLAAVQRAAGRSELKLQLLIRLTPLNPATVSYVLGATGVKFAGFLFACLAFTPHLLIEVYFGFAGKHVARLAGGPTEAGRLHDLVVIGGLAITVIVVVLISKFAHKALTEALAETGNAPIASR